MSMMTGRVESVTLIENIGKKLDYCSIQIDFDDIKIFGAYAELLGYVGKLVQYDIRRDIYKNEPITVVANIANMYTVQTVDKSTGIRITPVNSEERAECNFDIRSLKYNDTDRECIGFLAGYSTGSSSKTTWVDCTVIDRVGKSFSLRIFVKNVTNKGDSESIIKGLVGRYIKFNIQYTKYGYQSDCIELHNVPVVVPPEVETATNILLDVLSSDEDLAKYVEQYDFINYLKGVIDYEIGYHLVRIAAELSVIDVLENITTIYGKRVLYRLAIASRGYLLKSARQYSRPVLNINKVLRSPLRNDTELMLCLDPYAEEEPTVNGNIYQAISVFINTVMSQSRSVEIISRVKTETLIEVVGNLI